MDPRDRCIAINALFAVLLPDAEEIYVNIPDAIDSADMVGAAFRKIERNLVKVVKLQLGQKRFDISVPEVA